MASLGPGPGELLQASAHVVVTRGQRVRPHPRRWSGAPRWRSTAVGRAAPPRLMFATAGRGVLGHPVDAGDHAGVGTGALQSSTRTATSSTPLATP